MTAPTTGALAPLASAPSEALRLVAAAGREWAADGLPWATDAAADLSGQIREGRSGGSFLVGPSGSAAGVALWPPGVPLGRRAMILLDAGFRNAASLGRFVDLLRAEGTDGPLLAVYEPITGLTRSELEQCLVPRGLRRVERVDCTYPSDRPLPPVPPAPPGLRPLVATEEPAVARLLGEAYADNPLDLALFRHHADPSADLAFAAHFILGGELGPFWGDASFAVDDPSVPGRLLAAVIVNDRGGPLISEVGVVPDARGRGIARGLLARTVAAVRARTETPVRLVVTVSNRRAFELYRALGFQPVEATRGGVWIDAAALGLSRFDTPYEPRPGRS